jgi:hypothetical protein
MWAIVWVRSIRRGLNISLLAAKDPAFSEISAPSGRPLSRPHSESEKIVSSIQWEVYREASEQEIYEPSGDYGKRIPLSEYSSATRCAIILSGRLRALLGLRHTTEATHRLHVDTKDTDSIDRMRILKPGPASIKFSASEVGEGVESHLSKRCAFEKTD